MFLLVPAYPGCPGSKAVKRSLLLLLFLNHHTRESRLKSTCTYVLSRFHDIQADFDEQNCIQQPHFLTKLCPLMMTAKLVGSFLTESLTSAGKAKCCVLASFRFLSIASLASFSCRSTPSEHSESITKISDISSRRSLQL